MTDRGQLRAWRANEGDEFGFVAHRRPRLNPGPGIGEHDQRRQQPGHV
jgi:hypothetical protein